MTTAHACRLAVTVLLSTAFLVAQTTSAPKPVVTKTKPPAREPGLYATIVTSMGTIVGKLYEKESPITVKNFADLAMGRKEWTDPKTKTRVKRPLYNGLIFHRVIPGFMIQGGDPEGTGRGGTDDIPDEFDPSLRFDRPGRFGMANAGPGTGSSQFFITDVPTSHLDGRHTIFGQVVEGMDVVEKIARVARDENDRPRTPVRIVRLTVARQGAAPAKPAAIKPKAPAAKPKTSSTKPTPAKPAVTKPKTEAPK
jgi:peptidyl-prolyl cis-trans isomerase A (cyclophilin A)